MNQKYVTDVINKVKSGEKLRRREIFPVIGYLDYLKAKHATSGQVEAQTAIQNAINYLKKHLN